MLRCHLMLPVVTLMILTLVAENEVCALPVPCEAFFGFYPRRHKEPKDDVKKKEDDKDKSKIDTKMKIKTIEKLIEELMSGRPKEQVEEKKETKPKGFTEDIFATYFKVFTYLLS